MANIFVYGGVGIATDVDKYSIGHSSRCAA